MCLSCQFSDPTSILLITLFFIWKKIKWSWLQFRPGKTSHHGEDTKCMLMSLGFRFQSLTYLFISTFIYSKEALWEPSSLFQEHTDHTHSCTHLQLKSAHHNHSLICSPQHLRVKYPVGRLPLFIAGTHTDKHFLSCQWAIKSLPVDLICAVQWLAPRWQNWVTLKVIPYSLMYLNTSVLRSTS